jgi:uncharacterized protein YbjT (DUF2867 family)
VTDVVTGAFSFTGHAIAARLLAEGREVRTLSRAPRQADDLDVPAATLQFDDERALRDSLRGAETLYNTYWVRFPHGTATFEGAVANSLTLFRAAVEAGITRIVHVSVANPSLDSPYPYFRGKAAVERDLAALGVPYGIVRPTLVFGARDILVNNIAWILRRFPVFLLPGGGGYSVQPVAVEDVARLAVEVSRGEANRVVDAAGPDRLTFGDFVRAIGAAVGSRTRIMRASPALVLGVTRLAGLPLRDIVLTRDELRALVDGLLVSNGPATGVERFGDWLAENGDVLGRSYVSELARNWRRPSRGLS